MSVKAVDNHNRWRGKTVSFRMSPEENETLNRLVRLSGLTKQDYIIRRLSKDEVVVDGNSRVYKALRNELARVKEELRRIDGGTGVDDELLRVIRQIATIMDGMKADGRNG